MPLSPGNNGWPSINSAITHPVDQMSAQTNKHSLVPNLARTKQREPRTDARGIVGRTKDKLRCSVIPGADVADVGFTSDENLCAAKVAELEDSGRGIEEEVLGLDVAMADANRMDVC